MESGTGTSSDQRMNAALPASYESQQQHRPWADLPADILGVAFGRLALFEDRARLRSICRAWRAAALHLRAPPPLPMLVLSDFSSYYSFREEATMTDASRSMPLPKKETAADAGTVARCVGSFGGWLVGVSLIKGRSFGDHGCFLTNPFSRGVVRLPPPSTSGRTRSVDASSSRRPCAMSFCKVVLSSSPADDTSSKCVVAAISVIKRAAKLAFWRSGMKSWCVCDVACITEFMDIVFCHGKLYMLGDGEFGPELFAFEISEDDSSGLMVSRVEHYAYEFDLPEVDVGTDWRLVEWRGKLIVATCTVEARVRVFEVDLSSDPARLTEMESLDGDCIFITPCSSRSFRSCDYDGFGGDLIYLIDGGSNHRPERFVYSMKDEAMAPFAADIPEDRLRALDGTFMNPTWLFPHQ
ncbi:hypothetical protein BS78_04G157700 [Paspalum vaginatum]|nr:hypothetical protein BS78_04G157700 [Paspalum vaginatum]